MEVDEGGKEGPSFTTRKETQDKALFTLNIGNFMQIPHVADESLSHISDSEEEGIDSSAELYSPEELDRIIETDSNSLLQRLKLHQEQQKCDQQDDL